MDNNQYYTGNNQMKNVFKWVGFGCSCLGTLLVMIFSIVICGTAYETVQDAGEFKMSGCIWGVVIAAVIIITGIVFSVLSIERGQKIDKINKIVLISLLVGIVGLIWAIFPNVAICSWCCDMNAGMKSARW